MSDKKETEQTIYKIPDNFIDDSRAFRGMFRTKYLIEAIIMSIPFLLLSLLIPADTTAKRVTISTIFVCGPFILGISGIQGDSVFTFLKNFFKWRKKDGIHLYNFESRSLINTQTDNMMDEEDIRTKIGAYLEEKKKKREEERAIDYKEGDELEFFTDKHLEGNYLDEYEEDDLEEEVPIAYEDNADDTDEINCVEGVPSSYYTADDAIESFNQDVENGNIVLVQPLTEEEKAMAARKESEADEFTADSGNLFSLFDDINWESEVF